MEQEVSFRILLEKPSAGVDFGLQKGSGNNYETILKQRSKGQDLFFEFKARVKANKENIPTFTGPFIQGSSSDKFVYIDIGTYAGQHGSTWSRRLKIPLSGITWDLIRQLPATSKYILETKVAGTGKDGSPSCGTAKPFNGWQVLTDKR